MLQVVREHHEVMDAAMIRVFILPIEQLVEAISTCEVVLPAATAFLTGSLAIGISGVVFWHITKMSTLSGLGEVQPSLSSWLGHRTNKVAQVFLILSSTIILLRYTLNRTGGYTLCASSFIPPVSP
jgi:hypothetical protein